MKIYTQTGDQGKTSLLSGERVLKSDVRVRAYGDVDELNAVLGMLIAVLDNGNEGVAAQLAQVQSDLFHAGAWLATGHDARIKAQLVPITGEHCTRIEVWIDGMSATLPELKAFILPGGHPTAAWGHLARTVCRRAERSAIELAQSITEPDQQADVMPIIAFLNRLSDYFFVLARLLNQNAGAADKVWRPRD